VVPVASVCPAEAGEALEAVCLAADNRFVIFWDESHHEWVVVRSVQVDRVGQVEAHLAILVAGLAAAHSVETQAAHSVEALAVGRAEALAALLISQVAFLDRITDRGDLVTQVT
jgi:hypothetical protein